MFSRLVKYKELHGVSTQVSGDTCRVSTLCRVWCSDRILVR
jgi:hypothetical protein